jgi:hypothetical protein
MKRAVALLVLLLASCGDERFNTTWSGRRSIVQTPDRVEAFLLDRPEPKPGGTADWNYWNWKPSTGAVTVDAATTKQLGELLLDEKNYYRGSPKACIPTPGVKMTFTRGSTAVTVLLCFECRMLMTRGGGAGDGIDDFDPMAPALVAIVRKLFPKDAGIQSLK